MQSAQNGTSTAIELAIGLPTSSVSSSAISSVWRRISSAKRSSTCFLRVGAASRHSPFSKARRAEATARSTSAAPQSATWANDLAVDRRGPCEGLAAERADIGAVNEGPAFRLQRRGAGEPALFGSGSVEHVSPPCQAREKNALSGKFEQIGVGSTRAFVGIAHRGVFRARAACAASASAPTPANSSATESFSPHARSSFS